MKSHISGFLKRHQVLAFYVLTFGISWAVWIPAAVSTKGLPSSKIPVSVTTLVIIGVYAPAVSAIIFTAANSGKKGIRELLGRLLMWRAGISWYAFVLLGTFVIRLVAVGVYILIDGNDLEVNWISVSLILPAFLSYLIGALGEELGWRGYALPRLQADRSALFSSTVIGILWALWHLPGYVWPNQFINSDMPFLLYMLSTVATSILFTWIYNNSQESLLIAVLFHASVNTSAGFITMVLPKTRELFNLNVSSLLIVAIAVVIVFGPKRLSRRQINGSNTRCINSERHNPA